MRRQLLMWQPMVPLLVRALQQLLLLLSMWARAPSTEMVTIL